MSEDPAQITLPGITEYSLRGPDGNWRVVTFAEALAHYVNEGWQTDEIIERFRPVGLHSTRALERWIERLRGGSASLDPELAAAYRRCQVQGLRRPSQSELAGEMGFDSEDPIRARLRAAGISEYRKLHAIMAAHAV